MPNIEIKFEKYVPSTAVFYNYFHVLDAHGFITEKRLEGLEVMKKII